MTLSLHRCKVCGTRWLLWPDAMSGGGWNLLDKWQRPGSCCDNAAMGDQIEHLRDIELATTLRADREAAPAPPMLDEIDERVGLLPRVRHEGVEYINLAAVLLLIREHKYAARPGVASPQLNESRSPDGDGPAVGHIVRQRCTAPDGTQVPGAGSEPADSHSSRPGVAVAPSRHWKADNDLPHEPPRADDVSDPDWSALDVAIRWVKVGWWDANGVRDRLILRPTGAAVAPKGAVDMNLAHDFRAEADRLAAIDLTEQIAYLRAEAERIEAEAGDPDLPPVAPEEP